MEVEALPKETATPDVVSSAVQTALHIHKNMGPGDILIFMPGEQEIQRARGMLAAASSTLNVLPLHGSISKRAQDRIYEPSEQRRCIISTSIAETSLTIKNVVYIIDSGLMKEMVWNPRTRFHELKRKPVAKFSARQRQGRAGRVANGVCFRLYTRETFENDFRASIIAAIQMGRLESVILSLLCAGHKDLLSVDFLDCPTTENMASAIQELLGLQVIVVLSVFLVELEIWI